MRVCLLVAHIHHDRICPGQFFAENSLFITTASILHTLTIDYARDERGQSIVPDVSMTYGVVS